MKKTLYFCALLVPAILLCFACDKNESSTPGGAGETAGVYGNVKVTLNLSDDNTKTLTTNAKETKINSVQVFIFNKGTAKLETDRYETISSEVNSTYSVTLTSLTGNKDIWAVVNAPRLSGIETVNNLKQTASDLADNRIDNLLMTGCIENVEVKETNPNVESKKDVTTNADIQAFRLGARISLEAVTVDFTNTDLEGATFTLTGMYLKNVVGKVRMDGESSGTGIALDQTSSWYNLTNKAAVDTAPAAVKALTADLPVNLGCNSSGTATNLGYSWYVYPNPTPEDQDNTAGSSLPRHTRVVLKAHLSGTAKRGAVDKDTYYVFSIPMAIQRNYCYSITGAKITMEGKGDDDDDDLTTTGKLKATINVQDWSGTTQLTYEI